MSQYDSTQSVYALSHLDQEAKKHAIIAYALLAIGFFTGITWIAGAIWAMLKRTDARGSIFVDHYDNIIKTFWWSLALYIVGVITVWLGIGFLVLFGVWVWSIYKVVKGIIRITSDRAYSE